MKYPLFIFLFLLFVSAKSVQSGIPVQSAVAIPDSLLTPFEKGNGNQSASYYECLAWYTRLDHAFGECKMIEFGNSSIGKPLHLVMIDKDNQFDPGAAHQGNKTVLLINNGIHPGEPDGIDASMMLARDILTKPEY